MGRGGARYLSYTALVLLSTVVESDAISDLWAVSIWNSPAPSPQDGPPFSAHASRNRELLPYQIVGIVGSYVGSILILGILLLTVGRRLRRRAQEMAARPTEMVKPTSRAFDPSPISPMSNRSWYSPRRLKSKKSTTSSIRSGVSNQLSPGMDSVVSFDDGIVEADRQKRQDEMERLYAAVMAQDERKSQQAEAMSGSIAPGTAPPEYSRQRPPKLITDAPSLRHLQAPYHGQLSPRSPTTPKSPVRAIYPPGSSIPPMPMSPTSPIRVEYPITPMTPTFMAQAQSGELRPNREGRASSFGSSRTVGSTGGSNATSTGGKKLRKSLRHLKISAPLQRDDNSDGARTPLSPRFYTDPGIPPEPPTAGTIRTFDSQYPPTTPGTAKSWRYGEERDTDDEQMDEVRDLPQAHPNRVGAYTYDNAAQAVTNAVSKRPDPTGTTPQNKQPMAASVNNTLPFRQLQQQSSQQQGLGAYPLSPGSWNRGNAISAGPVKTTFLNTQRDRFGGPRTGLATPYSPYMPFTPLTPVTPHLQSRAERKQRQREERAVHGAITEEDQVADEKELWSYGY